MNSTQRTPEFTIEYKRVSISLNTHISVLDEHTKDSKGTVLNQALPSSHGGILKITRPVPSKMLNFSRNSGLLVTAAIFLIFRRPALVRSYIFPLTYPLTFANREILNIFYSAIFNLII